MLSAVSQRDPLAAVVLAAAGLPDDCLGYTHRRLGGCLDE
jgi:hypothetical protein